MTMRKISYEEVDEFRAKIAALETTLAERDRQLAEMEKQSVKQYTKFSDLTLAGGRLLSEAEERVAVLEAALRHAEQCSYTKSLSESELSCRICAHWKSAGHSPTCPFTALAAPAAPRDPSTNAQEGT